MNNPTISIVCAMDEKRGIGKDNKLLWNIPPDLKRFREITSGHPIIMGRKTFESIGRVLPNRTNIIITRDQNYSVENAVVVHSLDEAIIKAQEADENEIFVIGGGQIFEQALPLVDKLYLTLVKGDFGADAFFPDYSVFSKKTFEEHHGDEQYEYTFLNLEKTDLLTFR